MPQAFVVHEHVRQRASRYVPTLHFGALVHIRVSPLSRLIMLDHGTWLGVRALEPGAKNLSYAGCSGAVSPHYSSRHISTSLVSPSRIWRAVSAWSQAELPPSTIRCCDDSAENDRAEFATPCPSERRWCSYRASRRTYAGGWGRAEGKTAVAS